MAKTLTTQELINRAQEDSNMTKTTTTNNNASTKKGITMRTLPIATTDTRIIHCVQGILIDSAKVGVSEQEVLRMVQGILIDAPKLGLDNDCIVKKITETFKNMINKGEMIMKKLMEAYYAAGNNEDRAHTMYVMLDQIEVLHVKKDIVVELAKQFGMETKKSTSKAAAMMYIQHKANELAGANDAQVTATHQVICIDHAGYDNEFIAFEGTKSQCEEYADIHNRIDGETGIASYLVKPIDVSVDDLDITKDNAPQQVQDKKAKTDKLFALIKASAESNKKKGYGYTISSFMLQACILEAGAGVKKFKGHTVTKEEAEMTKRIYKYLLSKGFIKPVVYSVKEDENVRIYMPEYTGKTESTKTKLIPYNKSGSYTAKQITSFAVCC